MIVAGSLCVAAGCGFGHSAPTAPVQPAQGTVTYRGRPLENAVVVFAPVGGERLSQGRTDAEGHFRLSTFGQDDGAWIGKHRVSVQAREPDRPLSPDEAAQMGGEFRSLPGPPRIPVRYFNADTSGLVAEVVPGGPNDFRFDLVD